MKFLVLILTFFSVNAFAYGPITYFDCTVKEGRLDVHVKFAIKNLNPDKQKGELVAYPGADEQDGLILVQPKETGRHFTKMSNLNGQGGDLRILENGDILLYGDGDGYQLTDFVVWGDTTHDEEFQYLEGYVRDYGDAYGEEPSFKAFFTCKKSDKKL